MTSLDSHGNYLNFLNINNGIIRQKANHFLENYTIDLNQAFPDECVHLAQFFKDYEPVNSEHERWEKYKKQSKAKPLLNYFETLNIESMFSNVQIALHIFSLTFLSFSLLRIFFLCTS